MARQILHTVLLLFACSGLLCLSGCFETPEPQNINDRLLVEGYLFANTTAHDIRLQYINAESGTQRPASGLLVALTHGEETILLEEESPGSGVYADLNEQWIIEPGEVYELGIEDEGAVYFAETEVPYPIGEYFINSDVMSVSDSSEFFPNFLEVSWLDENEGDEPGYYSAEIFAIEQDTAFFIDPPRPVLDSQEVYLDIYDRPVQESEVFVFPGFVEQYGIHKLLITSYNEEYVAFAEAEPGTIINLGANAPGNIINGVGIFSAFAYSEVFFIVED